jgi:hypothetical protein
MMIRTSYIFLFLSLLLSAGCQSESSTEPPPDSGQRLRFTPDDVAVSIAQQAALRLMVENLTDSVFAISLQISYADAVVSFAGLAGAEPGDFFGGESLRFVQDTLSVLHVTVSRIQGQTEVSGSGTIGILQFTGRAPGDCVIEVLPDRLEFYDSQGRAIEVPELEIKTATVHVI